MPTVHLVSGLPGSGKTTYAGRLADATSGVVFSLDRWLITAFGRYALADVGLEEHTRRVLACRDLIWIAASELVRRSVDVVLDDGFFYRQHRVQHVRLAADLGARTRTHFINVPADVLRGRIEQRNRSLPIYNFHIDPDLLAEFATLYEPPAEDEGAELVVVSDTSAEAALSSFSSSHLSI